MIALLLIALILVALGVFGFDLRIQRSSRTAGDWLPLLAVIIVLVAWPLIALAVGATAECTFATLLVYTIVSKLTQCWSPFVGLLAGSGVFVLMIIVGVVFPGDPEAWGMAFICLAGGTVMGSFAAEMKRRDDIDQRRSR